MPTCLVCPPSTSLWFWNRFQCPSLKDVSIPKVHFHQRWARREDVCLLNYPLEDCFWLLWKRSKQLDPLCDYFLFILNPYFLCLKQAENKITCREWEARVNLLIDSGNEKDKEKKRKNNSRWVEVLCSQPELCAWDDLVWDDHIGDISSHWCPSDLRVGKKGWHWTFRAAWSPRFCLTRITCIYIDIIIYLNFGHI